jgi:ribosomal protein S18 acetylase RimI-like enzyme
MADRFRSRTWTSRADLALMQALAQARLASDWPALRIHPGDLDWWVVGAFDRAPAIEERVRLWFDATALSEEGLGPLRAYAWFSLTGQLDFQTATDDATEVDALVGEIVAWADERRQALATDDKPRPLKAWASLAEPAATSLAALGLRPSTDDAFLYLTGDLSIADQWDPPRLPDGFVIRPMASAADVEARVVCSRAAFSGSTMTAHRYGATFDANLYRRDLDLLMVDTDGRVLAFALGWLDPLTHVVELEPVGVHPDFHRRGLGREISRAALRRAREFGARRGVIGAEKDNPASVGLYQSLGLAITIEIVAHSRPSDAG